MKILIIYSTKYNCTKNVGEIIKNKIKENVDLIDVKQAKHIKIDSYDRIIFGTSVYMGKISKEMKKFVNENKEIILKKKYGIFLCCVDKEMGALRNSFDYEILENASIKSRLGFAMNFEKMSFFHRTIAKFVSRLIENVEEYYYIEIDKFIREIIS